MCRDRMAGRRRTELRGQRAISITDCVSFEAMLARGCREVIANDAHFAELGFRLPSPA